MYKLQFKHLQCGHDTRRTSPGKLGDVMLAAIIWVPECSLFSPRANKVENPRLKI
jgi:hypothetical protein